MVLKMKIKNGKRIRTRARSIGNSLVGAAKSTVAGYKRYKANAPLRQQAEINKLQTDIRIQQLREQKEKLLRKRKGGTFGNI